MRLSRDKVNKLAHVVTDAVAELDEVDFIEDRNTIRLEVRKILEDLLMQEAHRQIAVQSACCPSPKFNLPQIGSAVNR